MVYSPPGKKQMSDPVQRKLTTMFCADVHGYSRLMDIDEVSTLQTLKLHRQAMTGLMERHDGRVFATAGEASTGALHSAIQRGFSERYHASSRGCWPLLP